MDTYNGIIRERLKEIRKEWSKADDGRTDALEQVVIHKEMAKEFTSKMKELTKEKNILQKRLKSN